MAEAVSNPGPELSTIHGSPCVELLERHPLAIVSLQPPPQVCHIELQVDLAAIGAKLDEADAVAAIRVQGLAHGADLVSVDEVDVLKEAGPRLFSLLALFALLVVAPLVHDRGQGLEHGVLPRPRGHAVLVRDFSELLRGAELRPLHVLRSHLQLPFPRLAHLQFEELILAQLGIHFEEDSFLIREAARFADIDAAVDFLELLGSLFVLIFARLILLKAALSANRQEVLPCNLALALGVHGGEHLPRRPELISHPLLEAVHQFSVVLRELVQAQVAAVLVAAEKELHVAHVVQPRSRLDEIREVHIQ
mmetsp:Transcript_22330/g.47596  ORF Transcript_22330/g.47596 Transcript_22330/m.47596 type:complete len:307 (-) Transcript_22330:336-1256(-)